MVRHVQGMIEAFLIRGYRSIARQMNLTSRFWAKTEIVGSSSCIEKITTALQALYACSTEYTQLFECNAKTVLCIKGGYTNTFPVMQVAVVDSDLIEAARIDELVSRLIYVASYIEFYKGRFVLLPQIFQKKVDAKARLAAQRVASSAVTEFLGTGTAKREN